MHADAPPDVGDCDNLSLASLLLSLSITVLSLTIKNYKMILNAISKRTLSLGTRDKIKTL